MPSILHHTVIQPGCLGKPRKQGLKVAGRSHCYCLTPEHKTSSETPPPLVCLISFSKSQAVRHPAAVSPRNEHLARGKKLQAMNGPQEPKRWHLGSLIWKASKTKQNKKVGEEEVATNGIRMHFGCTLLAQLFPQEMRGGGGGILCAFCLTACTCVVARCAQVERQVSSSGTFCFAETY